MAKKFLDLSKPDEIQHAGPMAVGLYEYEEEGRKQTAVLLHRAIPGGGGSREMVCDLDRMEAALKHGQKLFASFEHVREPMEKVVGSMDHGTWNVRYIMRTGPDRPPEMAVAIDQDNAKGRQLFGCRLDELEEATKHAQNFEQERGHERPPWYRVVRCVGLEQDDSVARLYVEKTLPRSEAENYAGKNWRDYGTVVYEEPTRRKAGDDGGGYYFTPPLENALRFAPELATEIDYRRVERERRTPELLLGHWYDRSIEPIPGTPVKFDEFGRDVASREATPYRVTDARRADDEKPDGPNDPPIAVVVELHPATGRPVIKCMLPHVEPDEGGGIHPKAELERFQDVVRVDLEERSQRLDEIRQRTQEYIDLGRESMPRMNRPKL